MARGTIWMRVDAARVVLVFSLLILGHNSHDLQAQETPGTISGTVTDAAGKAITSAIVTAKNVTSGQSVAAQTDSFGHYNLDLLAGDYEITVSASGFTAIDQKTTVGVASAQVLVLRMSPAPPQEASPQNLPNAPSSSETSPSLGDLGFPTAETQPNAQEQALLDKRTHMLKIHQRMGLITTGPLIATVIASFGAGGRSTSTASRDLHVALGSLTGDLYGITAYYAIRAPRIKGEKKRGPIRFHEAMAWIHGPGMILTPILGAMAFEQKSNGQHVHGIAAAHGPVAIVTAGAFGAALLSVSVKF
jgi:Carboxypeptidase regulatory-like domain